ncbi:hypothetical protein [Pseudarthrobacter sp. DSP2-3-2b1]|uniref:hypothetical protein n=1 Tax=Pseudarthrobacter sp. DSP2-3-2b1 TaxID=2804661 RepID=UPI003CF7AD65
MTENTTQTDVKGNAKAQAAADKAYRKASRPWFKKKRFLLPLIILVIFIIATASNSGAKDTGATSAPATTAASAQAANPAAPAAPAAPAVWTKVAELAGSSDMASQSFQLSGKEARLVYSFTGGTMLNGQSAAIGAIYLMDDGKDKTKDGGIPLKMLSKDESSETAIHKSAGKYYLDVAAANFQAWTITVEEKQ